MTILFFRAQTQVLNCACTHNTWALCAEHVDSSAWALTGGEVTSAARCGACKRLLVPASPYGALRLAHLRQGELSDTYDFGRIAPRPHEHAAWKLKVKGYEGLGDAIQTYQRQSHSSIVALSQEVSARPRLMYVRCGSHCGRKFLVDHLIGHIIRLRYLASKGDMYACKLLTDPSLQEAEKSLVPRVRELVFGASAKSNQGAPELTWQKCCNCHGDDEIPKRLERLLAAATLSSERAGLKALHHTEIAFPLGVPIEITPESLPTLPLSKSQHSESWRPRVAMLLLVRERVEQMLSANLTALKGAPGLSSIYERPGAQSLIHFGDNNSLEAAAGGQHVNCGVVIVASTSFIKQALDCREEKRAAWVLEHLHLSRVEFVGVAICNTPLDDAFMTSLQEEEALFRAELARTATRGTCIDTIEGNTVLRSPTPALLRLLSPACSPHLLSSACSPLPALLTCSPPPALPCLLSSTCSPPPALPSLLSSTCSPPPALLSPACSPHLLSSAALPCLLSSACSPPPALPSLLSSAYSPPPLSSAALPSLLSSACSPPPLSSACSPLPALLTCSPPPALPCLLSSLLSSAALPSLLSSPALLRLPALLCLLSSPALLRLLSPACSPPPALLRLLLLLPALLRLLSSATLLRLLSPPCSPPLSSPPPTLLRCSPLPASPPPALLRLLSPCPLLPALLRLLSPPCSPQPALSSACLLSPALSSTCSPPPALPCLLSSAALLRLLSSSLLSSAYSPPLLSSAALPSLLSSLPLSSAALSSACSPSPALLHCSPPPALLRCSPPPALLNSLSSTRSPPPALLLSSTYSCSTTPALLYLLSSARSPALLYLLPSARSRRQVTFRAVWMVAVKRSIADAAGLESLFTLTVRCGWRVAFGANAACARS